MAKSKALAVSFHPYYLNKDSYAIKLMSIHCIHSGFFVWSTKRIIATHTNPAKLKPMAIEYALDNNMVFITGLVQGQHVKPDHLLILEKHYGVSLSELIT